METKEIRKKIHSIKNIWKLTGALETLSALKMKTSQKIALASRPFVQKIAGILANFKKSLEKAGSIFIEEREVENILVCVIASDRGFCGFFNQNILRFAEKEIKEMEKQAKVTIFPIGKKTISFFAKKGYSFNFKFSGIGDFVKLEEAKPIADFLVKSFLENRFQKIYLFYTDFISTFSQSPKKIQLLPFDETNLLEFGNKKETLKDIDFLVEPSFKMLADEIVPQLTEYLIYQCILESNASEHSSRMLAMKNASDNAQKRTLELQLEYNKARQEQITAEVAEISSARETLELT